MGENKNQETCEQEKNAHKSRKKMIIAIVVVLSVILIGVITFGTRVYHESNVEIKEPTVYHESDLEIKKPIIYLYPTTKTEVTVTLEKSQNITTSYPKYTNAWQVLAEPNGNLTDLLTNRKLYALYYENQNSVGFKVEKDGFVVKSENVAEFLEEKLAILGLTETEAEEFIVYWLPQLEENNYNYIRFATLEEINENMPLEIQPTPDTIIRVLMAFKGLEKPIEVKEQKLVTPERTGFVAVEWGGTEIK